MSGENSSFERHFHTYKIGETSKDASSSNKKARLLSEIASTTEYEVHQYINPVNQFLAKMKGKMRIFGFSDSSSSSCKDNANKNQYELKQEDLKKVSSEKSEAEGTDHPDEHILQASSLTDNQRSQATSSQDIDEILQNWNKDAEKMV